MANKSGITSGISPQLARLFGAFSLITLLSIFTAIATEIYFIAGLPVLLLFGYLAIVDFRKLFFLLFAVLPLSTEVALPGGFSTDLPSEGLMVALMMICLVYVLRNAKTIDAAFLRHPISLLLLLHLGWTFAATITSELFFVSLKFSLAKVWYVTVFYFMAGSMLKTKEDVQKLFWWVFLPLVFTILVVLTRYASYGFAFEDVNEVLNPFYRNHVTYASILVLFFPFVWFARFWYPKESSRRRWLFYAVFLLIIAIQFSYTRTAYIGLLIALGAYYVFTFKLTRLAIAFSITMVLVGTGLVIRENRFLDFAPDFEHTITHHRFENLLEATYKFEDISTMERVHRWVAGFYMAKAHPLMGFGPGNFYNFYRGYTLNSFRTYISDNVEKSGIHSYFLMVLVEQGFPGLLIFVVFAFYPLIAGERIYHQTIDPDHKRIVMASLLCLIVTFCLLLINDLIESDKVGPFFFLSLALLVNADLRNSGKLSAQ